LQENAAHQFGLNTGAGNNAVEGVVNTIIACTNVLVKTKRLPKDPLGDPYRIINSTILQAVHAHIPNDIGGNAHKREFAQLSESQWKSLSAIGTMRVEPISFRQGTSELSREGEAEVDKIADLIENHYPDARVMVKGHTGAGSDQSESMRLSQERAEAVVQRLIAVHAMSSSRMLAKGVGSSQPPEHRPEENQRAYMYRIPRVEFQLYNDTGF